MHNYSSSASYTHNSTKLVICHILRLQITSFSLSVGYHKSQYILSTAHTFSSMQHTSSADSTRIAWSMINYFFFYWDLQFDLTFRNRFPFLGSKASLFLPWAVSFFSTNSYENYWLLFFELPILLRFLNKKSIKQSSWHSFHTHTFFAKLGRT